MGRQSMSEATQWQTLGDIAYREIPLFDLTWQQSPGAPSPFQVNALRILTSASSHGGPIARLTTSLDPSSTSKKFLNIHTNTGSLFHSIPFPPPLLFTNPFEVPLIVKMGFTQRQKLVIVYSDSHVLVYDAKSIAPIIPPFCALPQLKNSSIMVTNVDIFDNGVAILASDSSSALVEFFDEFDPYSVVLSAHASCRVVPAGETSSSSSSTPSKNSNTNVFPPTLSIFNNSESGGNSALLSQIDSTTKHYALITPLPTAKSASSNNTAFCTLAVLSSKFTTNKRPEIFFSTSDNSVQIVDSFNLSIVDVDCRSRIQSPITRISFAPNGRFLACFTQNAILTVMDINFSTKVLDFDAGGSGSGQPDELCWCGEDSVILHWRGQDVLMVGPYGDWLRWGLDNGDKNQNFDNNNNESENTKDNDNDNDNGNDNDNDNDVVEIICEIDCCRVITNSSVTMLQRVSPTTANLFGIGSVELGAMLLDASDAFEKGDVGADEAAKSILRTGRLNVAIKDCVEGALLEFDNNTQKRLLRAASYGLHFGYKRGERGESDNEPSQSANFVSAALKLRVLNSLRSQSVGFCTTVLQFDRLGPSSVVARLVDLKRSKLALHVCLLLKLDTATLSHAAVGLAEALVVKISGDNNDNNNDNNYDNDNVVEDADVVNSIVKLFDKIKKLAAAANHPTATCYAKVAIAAFEAGKKGVAAKLLALETCANEKVPALIHIKDFVGAANAANAARDVDLITVVLQEAERATSSREEFFRIVVTSMPLGVFNVLKVYYGQLVDPAPLMGLLISARKFNDAGVNVCKRGLRASGSREEGMRLMREGSRVFALSKELGFQKSCVDEQMVLEVEQHKFKEDWGMNLVNRGLSVSETVIAVIEFAATVPRDAAKILNVADKLCKKFKIPEKRLWQIKVTGLAKSKQWAQLRLLGEEKKSPPGGFAKFAKAGIKFGLGPSEVNRYIEMVAKADERFGLYLANSQWRMAAECCKTDPRKVVEVKLLCTNESDKAFCDEFLRGFST